MVDDAQQASVEVEILLATCNGARYLEQQMDSLLQQSYPNSRILVRDDGSRDATIDILRRYAEQYPSKVTLLPNREPSGSPKNNFAKLMEASTAPYIMFSDQDDVWDFDKVSASLAAMRRLEERHSQTRPLLVYTDLKVVRDDLSVQYASFWKRHAMNPKAVRSLRSVLCGNVVAGCTMLFNRSLLRLSLPVPQEASMHDWWTTLLVCLFGCSTYLDRPTILYRQHGSNVIGSLVEKPRRPFRETLHDHSERRLFWNESYHMARALWREHGAEMSKPQRRTICAFLLCNDSPSRLQRVVTFIRHGFFLHVFHGRRPKRAIFWYLSTLWYLWDKDTVAHQA